jgi:hypothetical protein
MNTAAAAAAAAGSHLEPGTRAEPAAGWPGETPYGSAALSASATAQPCSFTLFAVALSLLFAIVISCNNCQATAAASIQLLVICNRPPPPVAAVTTAAVCVCMLLTACSNY